MRTPIAVLATLSATAPAPLVGLALFLALAPDSAQPAQALLYAAVAWLIGIAAARGILVHRLSAQEQTIVRYWALAPMLTLLAASMRGAIPLLALEALSISVGRVACLALVITLAASSAVVVWVLWRRLRDSLGRAPSTAA